MKSNKNKKDLEELIKKYELDKSVSPEKFHKDLYLYHEISMNPTLSQNTEKDYLNNYQLRICKEYKINYQTFLRNLYLLKRHNGIT